MTLTNLKNLLFMKKSFTRIHIYFAFLATVTSFISSQAQVITSNGQPAQLDIRKAGEHSIRITLKPLSFKEDFPFSPAIAESFVQVKPQISLRSISTSVTKKIGSLIIKVSPNPISIEITNSKGKLVQKLIFENNGELSFNGSKDPILGMGEGGPKPARGENWRLLPVQFDRRGSLDSMQPRWQADAYGSRNPTATLLGTEGWGLFVVSPWVLVDLRNNSRGTFIPWKPSTSINTPQTQKNQQLNQGKGIPPIDKIVPGLYDLFVFDGNEPISLMKDYAQITGPAAMPPKWALGYMQSHRTLVNAEQMLGIVDTFRSKKIPLDAVIYLGTGFAPVGWNKTQPSFEPNSEVFKTKDIETFFKDVHNRNSKVILHMVPWDRDKLPTLHGSIPAKPNEKLDVSHIQNYWEQHTDLVNKGADGFWPDEGDWFNLHERVKRHQLYYQGHLSTKPNVRPWSLQRNGYPGIAQWGGWVWSGDTESSWKTLEAQIAVGINYSLSIGPYWGSDIGGFYSNKETTAELYTRWHQFASFNGSFRSHGRTWRTRLPWGWGLSYMGPSEDRELPLMSELNNPNIEPIARKYSELHYELLPYTYTLAWEARNSGLPLMRAMWLHYPEDEKVKGIGSQYLWGRDILVAPVFEKGATKRNVYLPKGDWYDWWTNKKLEGGQTVTRSVDLSIMPIYVKAGAIIPTDPIRQYTDEVVSEPTTLNIYSGMNGEYTLYEDDGITQQYLKKEGSWIRMVWNDKERKLVLTPGAPKGFTNVVEARKFKVKFLPEGATKELVYTGKTVTITF